MKRISYKVEVETEFETDAHKVMIERLGHDEDYGFDYSIDWDSNPISREEIKTDKPEKDWDTIIAQLPRVGRGIATLTVPLPIPVERLEQWMLLDLEGDKVADPDEDQDFYREYVTVREVTVSESRVSVLLDHTYTGDPISYPIGYRVNVVGFTTPIAELSEIDVEGATYAQCWAVGESVKALEAIDLIVEALSVESWSPDTLDRIAEIVTATGREINDEETETDEERDAATERAIEYLTNPVDEPVSIVEVPVSFWIHVRPSKFGSAFGDKFDVIKFVVSPLESYAGYFGNGSFLFDGPEIEIEDRADGSQSAFWRAVSDYLNDHGRKEGHAGNYIEVEWSE